jgi:hypothetical protein
LITTSHTGQNIAFFIQNELAKWNISKSKIMGVVTDNGSNIVAAINILQLPQFSCFAHTLQLVINHGKSENTSSFDYT